MIVNKFFRVPGFFILCCIFLLGPSLALSLPLSGWRYNWEHGSTWYNTETGTYDIGGPTIVESPQDRYYDLPESPLYISSGNGQITQSFVTMNAFGHDFVRSEAGVFIESYENLERLEYYGQFISAYMYSESNVKSEYFTGAPTFRVKFDYDISINNELCSDESHGFIAFNLIDATLSQSIGSFEIGSENGASGTHSETFGGLNLYHSYYYTIDTISYSHMDTDNNPREWAFVISNAAVKYATPTPEPSTVILLGIGIFGIFGAKRKIFKK